MTTTVEKRHALLAAGWRRADHTGVDGKAVEMWTPPHVRPYYAVTLKTAWAVHRKETKEQK